MVLRSSEELEGLGEGEVLGAAGKVGSWGLRGWVQSRGAPVPTDWTSALGWHHPSPAGMPRATGQGQQCPSGPGTGWRSWL